MSLWLDRARSCLVITKTYNVFYLSESHAYGTRAEAESGYRRPSLRKNERREKIARVRQDGKGGERASITAISLSNDPATLDTIVNLGLKI